MAGTRIKIALGGAVLLLAGAATSADAGGGGVERAMLNSFAEVPTLSAPGVGTFEAMVDRRRDRITYTLRYRGMKADVQQAHIHLGRPATNGGVSAFLCSNLDTAPAGTPECPRRRGTVSGVITRTDVVGPADQGLAAGQFHELVRALRAEATYVNVHTAALPGGHIRGQIH